MGSDVIQKRNKSLAPAGNLALLLGRPDMSLTGFSELEPMIKQFYCFIKLQHYFEYLKLRKTKKSFMSS
jgi:hypothetical protein